MNIVFKQQMAMLYILCIFVFAVIYYNLNSRHFAFTYNTKENADKNMTYIDSLYFSTTTMATVGYGDIIPASQLAKIIVLIQELLIILFAGLFVIA